MTISVGGNDAGFADVLTECATPWWAGDCDGAIDDAQAFIDTTLPGRLSTLYASIRSKAPNARVVVVGYPRIFMGEDCNAGTWFSPEEQARLNQTADLLNARTSTQAAARGFGFANPTSRFVGHAVCDDVEWLNGLSNPVGESYHPNKPGHASGYTPTVSPLLTGATVTATRSTVAAAAAQSDELAAQQRAYAAADAAIEPEVVRGFDADLGAGALARAVPRRRPRPLAGAAGRLSTRAHPGPPGRVVECAHVSDARPRRRPADVCCSPPARPSTRCPGPTRPTRPSGSPTGWRPGTSRGSASPRKAPADGLRRGGRGARRDRADGVGRGRLRVRRRRRAPPSPPSAGRGR